MKKNCCLWVFGLIFITVSTPNIVPQEEVIDPMKYGQFAEVSSTNADLQDNMNMRNVGYYNSKIWWGWRDDVNMKVYSIDSITDLSTTTEETLALLHDASGGANNIILRTFDADNIVCVVMTLDNDDAIINECVSTDGGNTWTSESRTTPVGINDMNEIRLVDVFQFPSGSTKVWGLLMTYNDIITGDIKAKVLMKNDWVGAPFTIDFTGTDLKTIESIYGGKATDVDEYTFYTHGVDNKFYKIVYDVFGATFTETEDTGLSVPTAWNVNVQQYWVQGNQEFILDEDHFYYRTVGTSTWTSVSDTGTTTNGIVWDWDKNNEYTINWIIWKDSIYKIFPGGGIAKIQTYTGNAYVGWSDWFANGADKIYQLVP